MAIGRKPATRRDASFASYVRAWRLRFRKRARENERTRRAAVRSARTVAHHLARKFGVRRVALIGSVLRPGRFRSDSDVDLVVWGLDGLEFYRAWDQLEMSLGLRVDLIPGESASPRVRRAVEEGIELFG